jgi:uncharacterized membrane protein
LTGVLFACAAGVFFGAVNITMRRGLARIGDVDAGAALIAALAFVLVAATAVASGSDFEAGELWPFLLLGIFVPGLSQLLVVHAVQAAGASRAGILFGMAPLFSALFAIIAFGEPLRAASRPGRHARGRHALAASRCCPTWRRRAEDRLTCRSCTLAFVSPIGYGPVTSTTRKRALLPIMRS